MKTVINFSKNPAVRIWEKTKPKKELAFKYHFTCDIPGLPVLKVTAYTKGEARAMFKRLYKRDLTGARVTKGEAVLQTCEVATVK